MKGTNAPEVIFGLLKRAEKFGLAGRELRLYLLICSNPGQPTSYYKARCDMSNWAYGRSLDKLYHAGAVTAKVDPSNRRRHLLYTGKSPADMFGQPFDMINQAMKNISPDMNATQASIIECIQINGECSTTDLCDYTGLSESAVLRAANSLVEQNVLSVERKSTNDSHFTNHYKLNRNGK